jgi:flagellar biogenesis protein FliO
VNVLRLLLGKNLRAGWRQRWARRRLGRLRLADSLGLGDRRSVGILEVEGRRLLIGSTPQAVTLLAELDSSQLQNRIQNGSPA